MPHRHAAAGRRRPRAGGPHPEQVPQHAGRRHHRPWQHGIRHPGAEVRRLRLRDQAGGSRRAQAPGQHGDQALREKAGGTARPAAHRRIAQLARSQAPVYISGEAGTGKELVARMIHEQGPRGGQPFVPVNCGAIPPDLMESEFFGHKKGSFTGAVVDKPGLFQAAHGGTLFLDEVANLPLSMQVKLLRAIQEKSVRPVGAQSEVKVDARILSATHKDLGLLTRNGGFRQDLYYRINVIELHVPSLRERPEDIPLLVEFILGRLAQGAGIAKLEMTTEALAALRAYLFPGNVRELENILERALTLCADNVIRVQDLHLPKTTAGGVGEQPFDSYLDEVKKKHLLEALEATHWNKMAAAKRLGISYGALRYRLQRLGLDQ